MTEPIQPDRLLDRDLSRAAIQDYRRHATPALEALVDEGLAIFERTSASARGGDENLAVLFPALTVFEMLDAAGILLNEGAVVPARLPLRSAFEATLFVQFVCENDALRRGAAFVVEEAHRRMDGLDRWDPASQRGKQLRAALRKDPHGAAIQIPEVSDLKVRRDDLQTLVQKPHLAEAETEYQRLRKLGRRPPFYSYWSGPSDIQQLARHLRREAEYEILYRSWSSTAHGYDLSRQLISQGGLPAVRVLRDPEEIAVSFSLAFAFGLLTIRSLLEKYRPEEMANDSYGRWYRRVIRPVLLALPLGIRELDGPPDNGA